jgi:lipoprotein-anchoring transpeptidase ErfK/SrfK
MIMLSLVFFVAAFLPEVGIARVSKSHSTKAKRSAAANSSERLLEVVKLQILLERAQFSPGEIDGRMGANVQKALSAFQQSRDLPVTGKADDATLEALGVSELESPLISYTVSDQDAAGPFVKEIPKDPMEQAKLERMNYKSIDEELGEKFHSSPQLLNQLNPQIEFHPGAQIQVPNIELADETQTAASSGTSAKKQSMAIQVKNGPQESGLTIVVRAHTSDVILQDSDGQILFYAPATVGSERDPLPEGNWKVTVIRKNPVFYYNPKLFWDAEPGDDDTKIAPGPNNPVGLVWIGVSAPHYGIHGSPEPGSIGHSESHGCIRMTNWDAMTLASLVKVGTPVTFEP